MFGIAKFSLLAAALIGVGSRGPVKYSNVTLARVRANYWSVDATYPHFQPVSAVTAYANSDLLHFSSDSVAEWVKVTTKDMDKPSNAWLEEISPVVVTARPDLVSVKLTQYADTEGAHPNTVFFTFNYGFVGSGAKRLQLPDLFKRGTQPVALISRLVIAKLRERQATWVENGDVKALTARQADQFVIKPDRLTYIFSPYEMGSYAEGPYEVDIPFAVIQSKLNPDGPLRNLLRKG